MKKTKSGHLVKVIFGQMKFESVKMVYNINNIYIIL